MDEREHFPSLSQIFLIWMLWPYFKISKVICLINGKILNQTMKFPLLCQCPIQREFSKLFLNCPVMCTYFIHPCSPLHSWHGFCILLQFFQLFSLQLKFSRKWYMDHLLNCFSCPGTFSLPVPPLKLQYSMQQLFSSEVALGMLLTSYLQDQFWILEKGAHCFDFPWAC